jgi:hypothetical protein
MTGPLAYPPPGRSCYAGGGGLSRQVVVHVVPANVADAVDMLQSSIQYIMPPWVLPGASCCVAMTARCHRNVLYPHA